MAEIARFVTIQNELGLHARAAAKLVHIASQFPVEIQIGKPDLMVNTKSIMGVLMLAAAKGTQLSVVATGDLETCEKAITAIEDLINGLFGEDK